MSGHKQPDCGYGDESGLKPEMKAFINVLRTTIIAAKENNISLLEVAAGLRNICTDPIAYFGAVLHFNGDCKNPQAALAEVERIKKYSPEMGSVYGLMLMVSAIGQ